ncbi:MAG: 4Fe-4S dicluster domain-containing protein [Thermoanaerobacterales bacterium]|nr:4Fe-4S dicluster domain-containing protein [Thermoanaerobacterales bacterium]
MRKGVLVDLTRCVGCGSCAVACKLYNGLKWESGASPIGDKAQLGSENWTVVRKHVAEGKDGAVWRFVKTQCFHCLDPACASACFVKAIQKTPEGPVVYNERLCVGCRYCMLACPFQVPKYEWDKAFPAVRKCRFCYDRLQEGMQPACTSACPTGANKFGTRKELLDEAHKRIADNPDKYVNQVFGEKEYGGTSVLYLSDVPFDQLGFRTDVSQESIPSYTWKVLKWTPYVAVGWTAVLTALYLYTKRRADVEEGH